MLIEFRAENHRSIRDEQVLTMEASSIGAPDDVRLRRVSGHSTPLLPVAALYGANASGKSNVVSALGFMRDAVLDSHRTWAPERGVPRSPFAWAGKPEQSSLFEVTVVVGGVRMQYGFVANGDRFEEEWLYAWPKGRKQTWFERDGDQFKFGDKLHGENRVVEQVTRPNALFVSAAAQHRHEQLSALYEWFVGLRTFNVPDHNLHGSPFMRQRWHWRTHEHLPNTFRQAALAMSPLSAVGLGPLLELLKAADVGIVDLRLQEEGDRTRVQVRHRSTGEEAWLPLEEESQGTKGLFQLAPLLVDALWHGGLLVVDELEASLHPLLALAVVRQFNEPHTNPHNAQLVFTTHNTELIGNTVGGETALRRDQVWLTEKDAEGATRLFPLTDYNPRKAENLERGYLQGRYGAIPVLEVLVPALGGE